MNFQTYSDDFLERTLLPFVPHRISPNQVSWLRICSLPFIYYFLANNDYATGCVLFSLAALTDALDGAMARKRNRVTETGKVLDAAADRGLITLVAFVFIPTYFGWPLFIAIIALEGLNAAMAYWTKRKIGMNPGANWAGKIKMILQCLAFGILFLGLVFQTPLFLTYAYRLLQVSLVFTVVQFFSYPKTAEEARYAEYA